MKRKLPSTSLDANQKATLEMRQGHWKKITDALSILGTANAEKIAKFIGLDQHQVSRRTLEMEGLGLIYKPGTKTPTAKGRMACDYCLTGKEIPKTDAEVTYRKDEKSAHEYANDLIKEMNKPLLTQTSLF